MKLRTMKKRVGRLLSEHHRVSSQGYLFGVFKKRPEAEHISEGILLATESARDIWSFYLREDGKTKAADNKRNLKEFRKYCAFAANGIGCMDAIINEVLADNNRKGKGH